MALIYARYILRLPVVLSLVGRSDVLQHLSPVPRVYAQAVLATADQVTVNSTYYLANTPWAGRNVDQIPFGVDRARFAGTRERRPTRARLGYASEDIVLLCVQRLSKVKRVDVLLEVVARLRDAHPEVRLLVVGAGSDDSRLRRVAARLGIEHLVNFRGYVSAEELPAMYESADIFVSHSMMETFGVVFAEAMSSGLAIIAADTSCIRDVLDDDNARIVKPFDIDAFAAAVVSLMDPERRAAMAARNRARAATDLSWDGVARAYEGVLGRARM